MNPTGASRIDQKTQITMPIALANTTPPPPQTPLPLPPTSLNVEQTMIALVNNPKRGVGGIEFFKIYSLKP